MLPRSALLLLIAQPAFAQSPETPPAPLPQSVAPRLPQPEQLQPFAARSLSVKRGTSWQLWAGGQTFRDFGNDVDSAHEVARILRELNPIVWGRIGTDRPVVEYGLTPDEQGRPVPPKAGGFPKRFLSLDHRTARIENVRGAWCLRDDQTILLNCGSHRADAEQALAVARKYGFNRIGLVGGPEPVLTYFFANPEIDGAPPAAVNPAVRAAAAASQERELTRTGIEVPGVGFVGEQLRIDWRKVEVRKDRGTFLVAHGPDVLAKFGPSEWAARDAQRLVQDARLTEFCRFGSEGVTFFLKDGRAPQGLPFYAQGSRFDPKRLAVRELAGKWWVCEARPLLPAGSAAEAETLLRLVQAYGFDQLAQVGTSPAASLKLLAKAR